MKNNHIIENSKEKFCFSKDYNYNFNKESGFFVRWGETKDDDPIMSPFGPEIADIEISTICSGINNAPCHFCYKSNTGKGHNMSFELFKEIFHKFPKTLTQIAFGIGDIDANPDLWDILQYCRVNDYNEVIPNITINGARLTEESVALLARLCGAIAVSRYSPPDVCYDAVQRLTEQGKKQVNIHQLISEETYDSCIQALYDIKEDSRLKDLNAIVFLGLKPCGRGTKLHPVRDVSKWVRLVNLAMELEVPFGFDSCSAPKFLAAVHPDNNNKTDIDLYNNLYQYAEPCESMLFSIYINENGIVTPCSFMEKHHPGIDMRDVTDFMKEVWLHEDTVAWRNRLVESATGGLVEGVRQCPHYDIY